VRFLSVFLTLSLAMGCASHVAQPSVVWPAGDASTARYRGNLPTLDAVATYGDTRQNAKLVIDTGCEGVALSSSLVAALGLPSRHRLVRYEGSPVEQGGVGKGQSVSHQVGSIDVRGCFTLEGGEAMAVRMPGELGGLAGLIAFPDRAIVFDPATNRVHFVTRDLADQLARVEGAVSLPVKRRGNTLHVQVTIANILTELLVDTGARYSWISPAVARAAEKNGFVEGRLRAGTADLGLRVLRVETDGTSLEGGLGADVLLGLDRAVILDLERERVVLLPGAAPGVR
jgi:hypothetical protein